MNTKIKYIIILSCLMISAIVVADIINTAHNLSTTGPGTNKAINEDRICIFCHAPHNSSPSGALWNRGTPGFSYTPYSSSTIVAIPGQPTGASLLCLSCHDGTIAMGKIVNPDITIPMSGSQTMQAGTGLIGTDLTDDHPVSFAYTSGLAASNGELMDPSTLLGPVKLDANAELQCSSCHDPHDNSQGSFLVMANTSGALCTSCHNLNDWLLTAHSTSSASWDGTGNDPWPNSDLTTVSDNACKNCHLSHGAEGSERLLKFSTEEEICSNCHNSHVAESDVMSEFVKFSVHPVTLTIGVHDPSEDALVNNRHVECQDCHNPHAAKNTGSPSGPLSQVAGIDSTGNSIFPITEEYQLCYRCHADSTGKPVENTQRQIGGTNVRLEFDLNNASFHPIEGIGRNPNVPSLLSPWTTNSTLTCQDCHNSDNIQGPQGPHGSNFEPLLERRYVRNPTNYNSSDYDLCFKCHSESSIMKDDSFIHKKHTLEMDVSCNACHDPHGVTTPPGDSNKNTHLINFDTDLVSANQDGLLYFQDNGVFAGSCYLNCHDREHTDESY